MYRLSNDYSGEKLKHLETLKNELSAILGDELNTAEATALFYCLVSIWRFENGFVSDTDEHDYARELWKIDRAAVALSLCKQKHELDRVEQFLSKMDEVTNEELERNGIRIHSILQKEAKKVT